MINGVEGLGKVKIYCEAYVTAVQFWQDIGMKLSNCVYGRSTWAKTILSLEKYIMLLKKAIQTPVNNPFEHFRNV